MTMANEGDLNECTRALICSAQEEALRTNYIKFHIDKAVDSPLCRMCDERGESVFHLISECEKLAQREYKSMMMLRNMLTGRFF